MTGRVLSLGRRDRPEDAAADLAAMLASGNVRGVIVAYLPAGDCQSGAMEARAFGDVRDPDAAMLAALLLYAAGEPKG